MAGGGEDSRPYRRVRLFLTPGNHDIWSPPPNSSFEKYAGHPPHYSFDYGYAHFTILDNSRSDQLSAEEMRFLEEDLKAHSSQPLKFIVSHRPSWIFNAAAHNTGFPAAPVGEKVRGSVRHRRPRPRTASFQLEGIEYISMPSAGGHLRGPRKIRRWMVFRLRRGKCAKNQSEFPISLRSEQLPGGSASPS